MTRDEALKFVIPFGKYRNKTIAWVYGEDYAYLNWLYNDMDGENYKSFYTALDMILGD